jgi:proteic killer suppression protein
MLTLRVANVMRYAWPVIVSFHDAETRQLWETARCRNLPNQLHRQALKKLYILNAALALDNLTVPPGNRLEKLKGNREGQHSIRINDKYRICFIWRDGNAHQVEIVDYHGGGQFMRTPAAAIHPGEILLTEFMEPLGLTAYRLAKDLRVPQPRIYSVLHGKRAISADTAVRLGIYFNLPAQFWLNLQNQYDLRLAAANAQHRQIKPRAA